MLIISGKKNSGKTTLLLEHAAKTYSIIVCGSLSECSNLQSKASELGLEILKPITYSHFIENSTSINSNQHHNTYVIDDVSKLLQKLNSHVVAVTVDTSYISLSKKHSVHRGNNLLECNVYTDE